MRTIWNEKRIGNTKLRLASVSAYTQRHMSLPTCTNVRQPPTLAILVHANPLSLKLFPLPTSFSLLTLPNLVTIGGSLTTLVLVNMLKSGLSSSLGGGGLLGERLGSTISGSKISSSSECLDAAGDVGVDIERCMVCSGSRMICALESRAKES